MLDFMSENIYNCVISISLSLNIISVIQYVYTKGERPMEGER